MNQQFTINNRHGTRDIQPQAHKPRAVVLIDHLIGLIGLGTIHLGCTIILMIVPWFDLVECTLYAGGVTIAAIGIIGFYADQWSNYGAETQPFFMQPQRAGLNLTLRLPLINITLHTQPTMA